METKSRFAFVAFFSLLLLVGLASAADLTLSSIPTGLTGIHGQTVSGTITLSYSNDSQNLSNVVLSGTNITFSPNDFALNNGDSKNITFTASIPLYHLGSKTYNFIVNGTNHSLYNTSTSGSIVVSANETSSLSVESRSIAESVNSTTIRVTNNGNKDLSVTLNIANDSVKFNVNTPTRIIEAGKYADFTVNVDSSSISSTRMGSFSHNMIASSNGVNATGTITIEKTYCRAEEQGGNLIRITDIDDRSSGDDFEWEPLKDIRLRIEARNDHESAKRVTVKVGLYDVTRGRFVDLTTEERELEETIRISSGSYERYNFEFKLPADVDRRNEYRLYVKAFERGNEDNFCYSQVSSGVFFEKVSFDTDKDILADDWDIPTVLFCGETSTISFKLYNLDMGDEEIMRANLYSQELGLNIYSDEFELDNGDSEYIELNFQVPTKEAKSYRFTLYVEYDYRESSDTFRDSESLGTYSIRIEGDQCKINEEFLPKINVSLDSETETKVGEDLVVKITLTNPGDSVNFVTVLENYNSWADSASLDESTFYLAKGESKVVTATFKPTESGVQEFNVRAVFNGKSIEQKVTVDIEESTGLFRTLFGEIKFNLTFWLTIAIFIVLILIILVLLVRFISSNKE